MENTYSIRGRTELITVNVEIMRVKKRKQYGKKQVRHTRATKCSLHMQMLVKLLPVDTYTPLGANSVVLACVARTLSVEASWISAATVPMLTMLTCAGEVTEASVINFKHCIWFNTSSNTQPGHNLNLWQSLRPLLRFKERNIHFKYILYISKFPLKDII